MDPHADWGQQFGLPPAYHPSLYSPHKCGVISVDGTHDEQESAHHRRVLFGVLSRGDSSPSIKERQRLHPGKA